jgi:IS30 family transposase
MANTKTKKQVPLSIQERVTIEIRYCTDFHSKADIAKELGRNKSTITREIGDRTPRGIRRYKAHVAHNKAIKRLMQRGKRERIAHTPLREYVIAKLKIGWSPELIEVRLPHEYKADEAMRISYETIYQYIYAQIRRGGNGAVKEGCEDLRKFLVRRHTRRAKKGFRKAQKVERDAQLPSIDTRDEVVNERIEFGHWEDDTMVSPDGERLKTMNERVTRVHLFRRAFDGTVAACDEALFARLKNIPRSALKTLTRDRGGENRDWRNVQAILGVKVYFAHPYCSHERGSNENGNGLIRRHIPKGCDFGKYTDDQLHAIEYWLNNRPRKVLGGLTPCEVYYQKTGVALYC